MHRCALRTIWSRFLNLPFTRSLQPPRIARFSASVRMSSAAQLKPTNQHFSVDPEGKQVVDLTFASEALGMPAADGYGWAQFEFGDQIGEDNRYTITRKLGWGMYSSTWLARDSTSVPCHLQSYRTITTQRHT